MTVVKLLRSLVALLLFELANSLLTQTGPEKSRSIGRAAPSLGMRSRTPSWRVRSTQYQPELLYTVAHRERPVGVYLSAR